MTKLTGPVVEEAIEEQLFYNEDKDSATPEGEEYDYFSENDWSELEWTYNHRIKNSEEIPKLIIDGQEYDWWVIEADTGHEGHGEACFVVIRVGEQFFMKNGRYFSHYGTDWDEEFYEVEQFQKTVNDYRKVK